MLIIFKPSGATKANPEMALKLESLLQDNPNATTLKVRTDISDTVVPFIHPIPNLKKGDEVVIAGQGCSNTLIANLFSLWDRGVLFKIKKQYFLLCGTSKETQSVIEDFFGISIWEDEYSCFGFLEREQHLYP